MENYLKIYKNREEYEQNSGISIFSHIVESVELVNDTPDPCATPNVEVSVTMPSEATDGGEYAVLSLFRYDYFPSWDDKPFDVYVDGKKALLVSKDMAQEEILELINRGG